MRSYRAGGSGAAIPVTVAHDDAEGVEEGEEGEGEGGVQEESVVALPENASAAAPPMDGAKVEGENSVESVEAAEASA